MVTPRKVFEVVQGGTVGTWGGTVAATMIFAAVDEIYYRPDNEVKNAVTLRGSLIESDGADVLAKKGDCYIGGYLNFEDAPVLLETSFGTAAATTAGTSGAGTAYKRVYSPAGTVEDTPVLRRLEFGPTNGTVNQGYIPSAVLTSWEVSGKVKDWVKFTSTWWGPQYIPGTITGGLTPRSVERAKAGNTTVYVDSPVGGTIGTTQVTDCITDFSWKSGTLWDPKYCLSGSLPVTGYTEHMHMPTCEVTVQLGTFSEQMKAKYQAGSAVYLRLDITGGTTAAGTVSKLWRGEMCGQILAWAQEGNTEAENGLVAKITFSGISDTVGQFALCDRYTIINGVATLP